MNFSEKNIEAFEIQYLMQCNPKLTWEDCKASGVMEKARADGRLRRRANGEYVSPSTREAWDWFSRGVKAPFVELPEVSEHASKHCSIKEIVAFNYAINLTADALTAADVRHSKEITR